MEFNSVQIAKLVLGYLRDAKCEAAFEAFVLTSAHLTDYVEMVQDGKYFATRVAGLSLTDYLLEYAGVYTIVYERLEASNYFNENHGRNDLTEQLLYLLDNNKTSDNCSTRTKNSSDKTRKKFNNHLNLAKEDDKSLYAFEHNRSARAIIENEDNSMVNSFNSINVEVLTQTFLENHELHEKIAENINKEVSILSEEKLSSKASQELEATIKTIVERTEADPLFEKLLDEIIVVDGTRNEENENSVPNSNVDNKIDDQSNGNSGTEESLDNTKTNEAVKLPHPSEQIDATTFATNQQQIAVSTNSGHVVLFDGSLENYVTTCSGNNQSGLLMLQNSTSNETSSHIEPKSCYLMTGQQIHGNISQSNLKVTSISEQDILTMPTVIVCENIKPHSEYTETAALSSYSASINQQYVKIVPANSSDNVKANDNITLYGNNYFNNKCKKDSPNTKETLVHNKLLETRIETNNQNQELSNFSDNSTILTIADTSKNKTVPLQLSLLTPDMSKQVYSKFHISTPKSGSHVRALDFSSPPKLVPLCGLRPLSSNVNYNTKSNKQNSDVENDIQQTKPNKTCWDADLRALISIPDEPKVTKKDKMSKRKSKQKPEKKIKPPSTEVLNLKEDPPDISNEKSMPDQNNEVNSNISQKESSSCATTKENSGCVSLVDDCGIINRNKKARIKRKCNINNSTKKDQGVEEITVLRKVKEVKPIKMIDEGKNKLVLSPSKLNANKRTLLEMDYQEPLNTKINENNEKLIDAGNIIITSTSLYQNTLPLLQTPVKADLKCVPKTPGFFSPFNLKDTPFTKVLKEQLQGVDISTIPTPKYPITPNFAFTPAVNYQARPTDYSTGSSYYQPSDTEQNLSLEQLLSKECARLENDVKEKTQHSAPRQDDIAEEQENADKVNINKNINPSKATSPMKSINQTHKINTQNMKLLQQGLIAKKNLGLLKQHINTDCNMNSPTSDCSETTDDSNSSSDSDSSSNDTSLNDTLPNNSTVSLQSRYSLRPRQASSESKFFDNSTSKSSLTSSQHTIKNFKKVERKSVINSKSSNTTVAITPQQRVLQELELKRKRIIAKLKSDINVTKNNEGKLKCNEDKKNLSKTIIDGIKTTSKRKTKNNKKLNTKTIKSTSQNNKTVIEKNSSENPKVQETGNKEICSENKEEFVETVLKVGESCSSIEFQNQQLDIISNLDLQPVNKLKSLNKLSLNKNSNNKSLEQCHKNKVLNKTEDCNRNTSNEGDKLVNDNKKSAPSETIPIVEQSNDNNEFDVKTFESEHEMVIYCASNDKMHQLLDYNFEVLKKEISAKVYIEELDSEVEKILTITPFELILDIKSESVLSTSDSQDDSVNYAILSNETIRNSDDLSIKSSKKRKLTEKNEDAEKQISKKKKSGNYHEYLKKIDVDGFLNKVHGDDCW